MALIDRTLTVGAGESVVTILLTEGAMQLLDDLPGASSGAIIGEHRSLLTTITVGRAASGRLSDGRVVVDVDDILGALKHSGALLRGESGKPAPHKANLD